MTSRSAVRAGAVAAAAGALLLLAGCDFSRGEPLPDAAAVDGGGRGDGGGPSFAGQVHTMLVARCKRCHGQGGVAASSGFVLTGKVADDYAAAVRFVSGRDPAKSALVTKARGEGHGGGKILTSGSADDRLLASWIRGGARP